MQYYNFLFFVVENQSTIHRSITAYNQLAPLGLWSEQRATDCAVMGDLSGGLELSGIKIIKRAIELDSTKRYTESLICYQEGIQILMQAMKGVWLVGEHKNARFSFPNNGKMSEANGWETSSMKGHIYHYRVWLQAPIKSSFTSAKNKLLDLRL